MKKLFYPLLAALLPALALAQQALGNNVTGESTSYGTYIQ